MKRFVLTVCAVCMAATMCFAAGNQPATENWSGNINVNKLSRYLDLTDKQYKEVLNICEYFEQEMERAINATENRDEKLRKAVYGNLKLMKATLDKQQYAAYAKVLNATLRNKGIELK